MRNTLNKIWRISPLLTIMAFIGVFTIYSAANTYEVVFKRDLPVTNIVKPVTLTENKKTNETLVSYLSSKLDAGSFGTPKKIKFPETYKHIDVTNSLYENDWKASSGIGHTFITESPKQKVFGKAVIYLRTNTFTTKHLGRVYVGDIVNVVTTEGWQLGYEVSSISDSVDELLKDEDTNRSQIVVIFIDDNTGSVSGFTAYLSKVGERI